MLKVAFIGGSRLLVSGLESSLSKQGTKIAGTYKNVAEVAPDRNCDLPIVYLLKHSSSRREIREQIAEIKASDPGARVAVLAEELSPAELVEVFAGGGDGLILEDIGARALYESLRLIVLGEKVFPSQLAPLLYSLCPKDRALPTAEDTGLTKREIEIVRCLTEGMSNKAIAIELDLAVATVKVHVKSLLRKLGFNNRTQAAIWALETGVVGTTSLAPEVLAIKEADTEIGRGASPPNLRLSLPS